MTEKEKRERVVKGLECCLDALVQSEHEFAENGIVMSSWQDRAKRIDAIREAIVLLKEQEPVKPYGMYSEHMETKWLACGACNQPMVKMTPDAVYPNYCPECGRAVKWE